MNVEARTRPTIGFLTHRLTDAYGRALWSGVADLARERDVNLLCFVGRTLGSPRGFEIQSNVVYDLAAPDSVDGVIVSAALTSFVSLEEFKAFCDRFRFAPVTSIGVALEGIPSVLVDNEQGLREALHHLIEVHGRRRVAFIRGPIGNREAEERYRTYTETLAECGLPCDPDLVTLGDFERPSGARAMHVLLDERGVDLDAVVAANDYMALGALETLRTQGIQVPRDVALVGFDDSDESGIIMPPLTTVRQPLYKMGRQAAELVLRQIAGEPVSERVILPTEFVARESCGCPLHTMLQAAREETAPTDETRSADVSVQRERILSDVAEAIGASGNSVDIDWAEQLVDAFAGELSGAAPQTFVTLLSEILRQVAGMGGDVAAWQDVVSVLYHHSMSSLGRREASSQALDLRDQARVLIGRTAERAQAHRRLQMETQSLALRDLGDTLITMFDLDELMDVMAQELPRLGIKACCLSLYEEQAQASAPGRRAPTEQSRLILAYDESRRVELEKGGIRFPTRQLAPDGILSSDKRRTMIVKPLYFWEDQFGFALFEAGAQGGIVYETLRGHLSSALKGALLFLERKRAEEALRQHTRALALIHQASRAFSSSLDPSQVLATILEEARRLLDISASSIWLVDQETQELVCRQATGPKYESVIGWRLAPGEGIAGWVATHGESLIVPDTDKDERHSAEVNRQIGLTVRSVLSVPLRTKQSVIGVLQMLDKQAGRFDTEDLQILEPLAASAAIAIENARLYQQAQQEIDERKQAEDALAAERTLLRTIVDILPVLVYAKDAACRKILANHVDLEYVGASTEAEVLGKTDFDFYPEDVAAQYYARDQAIIQTGQPLIDHEHTIVTADGRQRWLLTSKVPLRDSVGKVIGLVGVGQDITERKRAEEALRESEEKYRNVVERANDGIIIIQDSLVRYANLRLAEMWGGSVEEMIGTRFTDYVDPDELAKVAERYAQRVAGERVAPVYETVLRRRNGEQVYVELNAGVITYQDRPADLVIVRDITERKQAEGERAQAAAALRRYVERLRILRAIDGVVLAAQSPQDIGQAVSRHLRRLVPSDRVLISSFDLENEKATVLASLGDETWPEAGAQIELGAFGSIGNLQTGKVSVVGDAQAIEETPPGRLGALLEDVHSYIHIPLIAQGELVGSLLLASGSPAAFTTEHVEIANELSGQLAIGIHQTWLREQVRRHAEELEQQVAARTTELARRTTQLQVAAEVARDATAAHDLDELLNRAVDLVQDRFEFYHAGIFLTDEQSEYAILRSATGEAGRQMLEHGHRLKVGEIGIVGHVCASGEPRIALDVGADASYFTNPFLPNTRSEMALPMRVGGRVIGALDVQSTKEAAFDHDDVEILQVLADQLAVAIERTRLFEQVQATLEERLHTVISNAPVILFALDREGVFTLLEGQGLKALGLDRGEHVGSSISDVYRDYSAVLDNARRALAGETVNPILDFGEAVLEVWFSPVRNVGGEVTGVIGVAVDVTERERLEKQIQHQERLAAVGQLAGGIAHDFNNFLMTIIFYAHLLLRDKDTSPDIVSVAETIVGEANRAAALVRQVLDFSRRSAMETQPVDLASFVAEVMDILQQTLPENIRVVTEIGDADYTVEIDPTRIQQVIMNLALNSRDAMPEGGELCIGLSRVTVGPTGAGLPEIADLELTAGDWVRLSVQDTGTGMDARVRAHLFEPFFTTKGPKGNGLGLAQVYGIVKQHGGEIRVETEVGRGTTFQIYLPVYAREPAQVTEAAEMITIPEGRGDTILLVEDEDRVRNAGQRVLQSLGYRVLTASNGREGLETFRKAAKVDLVLTDMVMPEMGGKELIQELRRIAPGLKALVITGYTLQEDVQALKDSGFADIVYKPLDVGELGRAIRRILDAGTKSE